MNFYEASPAQLKARWLEQVIRRDRPILILVFREEMRALLQSWMAAITQDCRDVTIETVESHARQRLPVRNTVLLNRPLLSVIGRHLPQTVTSTMPTGVPGLHSMLLQAALDCRAHYISYEMLQPHVPWASLMLWLDRLIAGAVFDTLRLYQYANEQVHDTKLSEKDLVIYGLDACTPAQFDYLTSLSMAAVTTTIYGVPELPSWITQPWKDACSQVEHEDRGGCPTSPAQFISLSPEDSRADVVWGSLDRMEGPVAVIDGHGRENYAEYQWIADQLNETFQPALVSAMEPSWQQTWQTFAAIAQNKASRAEALQWIKNQGATIDPTVATRLLRNPRFFWSILQEEGAMSREDNPVGWLKNWRRDWEKVQSWSDGIACLMEAVRYHGMESSPLAQELKGLRYLDGLNIPWDSEVAWEITMETMGALPQQSNPDCANARVLGFFDPLSALLSAALTMVVVDGEGIHSDEENGVQGLVPASVWRRPSSNWRFQTFIQALRREERVVVVGERVEGFSEFAMESSEPTPLALPVPARVSDPLISQWYDAHHHQKAFNEYHGVIGEFGHVLFTLEGSPSSLEQFGLCPLSYFLRYGLQLDTAKDEPLWRWDPAQFGKWMHEALDVLINQDKRNEPLMGRIDRALDATFRVHPIPEDMPPLVVEQLTNHIRSQLYEVLWGDNRQSLLQDTQTEYALQWDIPTAAGTWHLSGRLDRVDYTHDGHVWIMDYKTGRLAPVDDITPRHLQMPLYHQGLQAATGIDVRVLHACLWGITSKNQFRKRCLTKEPDRAYAETKAILSGIAQRVQDGQFFPAPLPHTNPCQFCMFQLVCPGNVLDEVRGKWPRHREYLEIWQNTEDEEHDVATD